jgi:hypothetical protein
MKEIIFTNVLGLDFFPPKPAVKEIPDWYKNMPEYVSSNGKIISETNTTPHTIKKCMPVFDAITAGYILYTQTDVQVTQENGLPYYRWSSQNAIGFHPIVQASLHPNAKEIAFPKWDNPYSVKTPPGYSTLFIPPMHNPNGIFTILPGVVDTDIYTAPVNFPFTLDDIKWEGLIPAGTPMVQVIPIKRDVWEHKIGTDFERREQSLVSEKIKTLFFNSYKRQFWSRKEYK